MTPTDYNSHMPLTWCPGCGNFGIYGALKTALSQLEIPTHELVLVYGIGCAGNFNNFVKGYIFHGLHGRAIPAAAGIKLANKKLKVIAIGGDGDMVGEGLNHFINGARFNYDLTVLINNNQVYSLTTGQTSPTSLLGSKTVSTPEGSPGLPVNPVSLALVSGANFVARGFSGNIPHLITTLKDAITHPGFSVVDILQPCLTFNKLNTSEWYKEKLKLLESEPASISEAIDKSHWTDDAIHYGVFSRRNQKPF